MKYAIYNKYGEVIQIYSSESKAQKDLGKFIRKYPGCYVDEYWGE